MTLPVIKLSGTPREQGRAHGESLAGRIATNISVYYDRLQREAMLSRLEADRRATLYLNAIKSQNPDYADGMLGIAEGSRRAITEIAMLNVRYELLYYQFGVGGANSTASEPDGCTAFALQPSETENAHLWLGQNWDWIPEVQGAIIKTIDADGTQTLAFTEAGIVGGKIGLNNFGVGICINGMTTTKDDWSNLRKPFHVRCYEILRRNNFQSALAVITGQPRACTTNFLIAQSPDQVADLETAPDTVRQLSCNSGMLVHTNNFLAPEALGVAEAPNPRRPFSVGRCDRMAELLRASPKPITLLDLQDMLKDHVRWPYGICRHRAPDEPAEKHYITVTSVIMDLDAREMRLTDGPPCESAGWQDIALGV